MRKKMVSLKEVNERLPALKEKVVFLQTLKHYISEVVSKQESFFQTVQATNNKGTVFVSDQEQRFNSALSRATELFYGVVEELREEGCIVRDLRKGIINFYHMKDNKEVLLSWNIQEEKVQHWHEKEGTYNDRQPLQEYNNTEERTYYY